MSKIPTSFNDQAAYLIENSLDLIKQVLVKHSSAVLEEMRDQIVSRNNRISKLEEEVMFNANKIAHAIAQEAQIDELKQECAALRELLGTCLLVFNERGIKSTVFIELERQIAGILAAKGEISTLPTAQEPSVSLAEFEQGSTDIQLLTELAAWCSGKENAMQGLRRGYIAKRIHAILASLRKLQAIEEASEMPEEPKFVAAIRNWHNNGVHPTSVIAYIDALRLHAQHLASKGKMTCY